MSRLVVVGDALLDRDLEGEVERLCPEAPVPVVEGLLQHSRPGGAGLAAVLAARDGHEVVLVTALAGDAAGRELRGLLAEAGVEVCDLGLTGATPEKVRVRAAGRILVRLDHGPRDPGSVGRANGAVGSALAAADAVLVADYGRGVAADAGIRAALVAAGPPVVWDPHPRGPEPVRDVALATPNAGEARDLVAHRHEVACAAALLDRWSARAVAVTLGERGAVLAERGASPALVPCRPAEHGDPCGAGDRFAATAAGLLAEGASVAEAVEAAVGSAAAFVAAGGAGALAAGLDPGLAVGPDPAARSRARGGTVVATGGCFDLLHAGHVRLLESARALGDCLVVLLNSDESVARLKGSDRPLVPQDDRAAVLRSLGCVDAVVVFDEDTPEQALERLRPDVWVKGGDYEPDELPEAEVVARHGGRIEILPYVEGRSTTRLIEVARGR